MGAVVGVVVGATAYMVGGVIDRFRPSASRTSVDRPVRLFRRRDRRSRPVVAAPSRSVWRRWPFVLGFLVQLPLMAAFGAGAYLRWYADGRLADAIAAADRDDPHWRLNELMAGREPVPDVENSAIVVREALALLPADWPQGPPRRPGQARPPESEAGPAFEQMTATQDNVRLDDATADRLRRDLEKYREAVAIARSVRHYDRGRHELELGRTLIDTLLKETHDARAVGRLLAADAAIRVRDGDPDGALDSCLRQPQYRPLDRRRAVRDLAARPHGDRPAPP